jgi:Protein kinase domain/PEGA domain
MLERAARLRPEPGTNVLTYGTNRLERYHPYLRLAQAYLLAGRPAQAEEALKRSEARGREPADERARIAAEVRTALETARASAAPPVTMAAGPVANAPAPPSVPPVALAPASAASPPPAPAPSGVRTSPPARSAPVRSPDGRVTAETRAPAATSAAPPAPAAAPASAVAALVVYSDPPGASVYLDDELVGATDPRSGRLLRAGVSTGPHRLRLTHSGLDDAVEEVTVAAPGPTTVRAHLSAPAPGGASLLAWAAGAVLALMAVLVFFVARSRARARDMTRRDTVARPVSGGADLGPLTPGTLLARRATAVSPSTLPGDAETAAITPSGVVSKDRFGEFRLLEPLGKGGMATVYRAERRGEVCALKRPLSAFLEDPEFLERFLREAEIGRTLHHPNIIRIYERGDVDGVPYFTMELVGGETLHARIRAEGAFEPRAGARVVTQVAEALDYAHLKGVIHRDLKPSNIMILADGTVKVMDYGIARARRFEGLTVTGAFLGTPDYVAPETVEGKGADARSDLYSLGIVFYELLTGRKPFVGDTPFATLRKHVSEPPTPPSVIVPGLPKELEEIILKLLSKSPDDRYPGAEELLIALRDFLNRAA